MKYILGIDTSSTDLGIGLYGGDRSIASYSRYIGNSHAEHINPALHMILTTNRITPDTISHIAIAVGPGSFTGLRIGIAFTKGFCIGTTTRILPLSSLFILAHAGMHHKGRIVSAIDARNDCVFWATFTVSGGKIDRLTEDKLSTIQSFTPMLATDDLIVTDTMGYKKSTIFSSLSTYCTLLAIERHPLQRGLICAATGAASLENGVLWTTATSLSPNYLRRSTPEERQLTGQRSK